MILDTNVIGNTSVIHDDGKGYVCDKAEDYAEKIKVAMKESTVKWQEKAYQDVFDIYNIEAMKKHVVFNNKSSK